MKIVKHVPFEDRTVELVKEVKNPQGKSKKLPFKTNQITADFINNRYVVLRDFVPKEMITFAMDCWKTVEHNPEWHGAFCKREDDIIFQNAPCHSGLCSTVFQQSIANVIISLGTKSLRTTYLLLIKSAVI
jgi:hypothetical protein